MLKFYPIVLLLFIQINVFSQSLWFDEHFNNNKNAWETSSDEMQKAQIKGGYYVITKLTTTPYLTYKKYFIDYRKNYEIRSSMSFANDNPRTEYGLAWSIKDPENYYSYVLIGTGQILIRVFENAKPRIIYKGTAKIINDKKKFNNLSIKRNNDSIRFSLNDSIIYVSLASNFNFTRYNFGFEISNKGTLTIDSLCVYQENKINLRDTTSKGLIKTNLGQAINSKFMEAAPVISADGKSLYWAVKGDPKNTGDPEKYDIWYSTFENGVWAKRKNIGKPLNNDGHNWIISVSPDNNQLLLANKYKEDGSYLEGIGISKTLRSAKSWDVPADVIINDYENISRFANYCLSPDQKVMIMAIETPDGKGDQDLYVSFLKEDGTWSMPLNIAAINTPGRECAPFIAADGTTLYFSTNGRPGFGDNDIFVSSREDQNWMRWSEPLNLGHEINTSNFDADYTTPASGEFALMVSKNNSLGGSDIFKIVIPSDAKPRPVILIKGKVMNSVTNEPIVANISYNDLLTDEEVGIAVSAPADGAYSIVLPPGTDYSMIAKKDGFLSQSEHIHAIEVEEYTEMEVHLNLIPLELGVKVALKNLFFETGKGVLKEESTAELNRLLKMLIENPTIEIEVGGHTDNTGSAEENLRLSQERAEAIRNFIVIGGVDANRIKAVGYGVTQPIATNDTDEGRSQNRRVEFKIIKK